MGARMRKTVNPWTYGETVEDYLKQASLGEKQIRKALDDLQWSMKYGNLTADAIWNLSGVCNYIAETASIMGQHLREAQEKKRYYTGDGVKEVTL